MQQNDDIELFNDSGMKLLKKHNEVYRLSETHYCTSMYQTLDKLPESLNLFYKIVSDMESSSV